MSSTRGFVRRARRTAALLVGLFSLSMLVPAPAAAQTPPAQTPPAQAPPAQAPSEAQVFYDQGIALRAAGKHEQAIDQFRRSLLIEHRPPTFLALASSLNEIGKPDEAIAALDDMFREFDATMKPKTREKAEKALLVLEGKLGFGRLDITANEKGAVLVDGKPAGTMPLATTLRLKEGPHSVRIERPGVEPILRDIVVVKGAKVVIEFPPVPIAKVVEPVPVPIAKVVEPVPLPIPKVAPKFVAPKPVVPVKAPKRFHVGGHVAFLAGIGTSEKLALVPPTTCGVYCLPALGLLAGVHVGIPIRGPLLVEFGGEYLHAASTLNVTSQHSGVAFAEGVADAVFDFKHTFTLDGGLVYAAMGANVPLGKHVRIEGRAGIGAFLGQSVETASGRVQPKPAPMQPPIASLDIAEVNERTASILLPVLRSRLGVSVGVGPVWLGIAVEGVVSATKGPPMCVPEFAATQANLKTSVVARVDEGDCPDGVRSARPFERLLFVAPEVSLSGSF